MVKEKVKNKKMFQNRRAYILLLMLCLGVGFALLSTNLTITGNTSVSGNKWNVYFTNVQVSENSVEATVAPTTSGTNTTSLDYTVLLDKPGDFYEFTVDAVNNGTIDAMIESINMTSLDTDVAKYLSYTATYINGVTLESNDVLEKNSSETYKVRVEYKTNINAEDLNEEGVNLSLTFGVNYVQSSSNHKLTEFTSLVKATALRDRNIDFTEPSSATNGRGLYILESSKTDEYPIYYYRGAVNNNNAKFAGFCWKVVRTTETGGTKLIYNGLPETLYATVEKLNNSSYSNVSNDENYPFSFSEDKMWVNSKDTSGQESTISFSVEEAGNYYLHFKVENISGEDDFPDFLWEEMSAAFYKDGVKIKDYSPWDNKEGYVYLENLTPSNTLSIEYSNYFNDVLKLSAYLEKGVGESTLGCANTTGDATQLDTISIINTNSNSPAYNGYMYGTVYELNRAFTDTNYVYGNTFTYENGMYTLSDTHAGVDSTHHYTCFSSGTSCESIKYVFHTEAGIYSSGLAAYYISLTDGKNIDTALAEMKTNTTNSNVKTAVDDWFSNTFATYFTTNSKNYNDYLEDTVWCNDRSMNTIDTDGTGEYTNNGWKPNGGSIDNYLKHNSYGRMKVGTPSLSCSNKNDSFTVEESATGNGALTYPVGLLTADEVNLAGGQLNEVASSNQDFYLYTNRDWWTMSPYSFDLNNKWFSVNSNGYVDFYFGFNGSWLRPSVSLKADVKVRDGGDGSSATPYEFVLE